MGGLSLELVLAMVCAFTFFRAGQVESLNEARDFGFPWALISALISALVLVVFNGSWGILLLSQAGLFFGIGIYRALRDSGSNSC